MSCRLTLQGEIRVRPGRDALEVLKGLAMLLNQESDDPDVHWRDDGGEVLVEFASRGHHITEGELATLDDLLNALVPHLVEPAYLEQERDDDGPWDRYVGRPGGEAEARSRRAKRRVIAGLDELDSDDLEVVAEALIDRMSELPDEPEDEMGCDYEIEGTLRVRDVPEAVAVLEELSEMLNPGGVVDSDGEALSWRRTGEDGGLEVVFRHERAPQPRGVASRVEDRLGVLFPYIEEPGCLDVAVDDLNTRVIIQPLPKAGGGESNE